MDALSRYDGLRAIRLNPLGAYAFGLADTYQSAESEPIDSRSLKVHRHLAVSAEAFDEDPFEIFAWRGRDREELLENLAAARSGGDPAADRAEPTGPPLAECLDSFFVRQAELPVSSPPVTSPTALLDQLPEIGVTVRRRALIDVLRTTYVDFGRG